MTISLVNTLSGKKEKFVPLKEGEVKIYLCGPTVYDEPHIGHARSAFVFEVIRRYFCYRGYKVRFVRNVTDVDDKIIDRARELGYHDLREASKQIAEKYYNIYSLWMNKLGISSPDIEPWATDHILEMQDLIQKLITKGYAYIADNSVYYSVRKFRNYGWLSRRSLDDLISGARIEPEEAKRDPLDFALWKKAKKEEPSWDSPWGNGRPGWHIECSVMSMLYLGENFDIHCGGQDLIFPHHENEIAQSQAVTGKPFANYWLHNGLLTIEGEKMAKSLGNFVTVEQVLEKYHPDVLKLFFLSAHYRSPLDFSWQKLQEFKTAKEHFDSFFSKVKNVTRLESVRVDALKVFQKYLSQFNGLNLRFIQAMDDDFNTPQAVAILYELINLGNKVYQDNALVFYHKMILLSEIKNDILNFGKIFSLFSGEVSSTQDYELLLKTVIKIRDNLRREKQFELADKIREELFSLGIILEDGENKTTWRKIK